MFKPFKPPSFRKAGSSTAPNEIQHENIPNPAKRRKLSPPDDEDDRDEAAKVLKFSETVRSPLQTLKNPPSPVKQVETGVKRYYSIVWRKVTGKKNKTWEDDGALAFRGGAVSVYDSKGRRMGGCTRDKPFEVEDTLSISGKDVQIESEISYNDFCVVVGRDNSMASPNDDKVVIVHGKLPVKDSIPAKAAPKMSLQEQMRQQIQKKATPKASLLSTAGNSAFRQPLKESQIMPQVPSEKPIPRHDPEAPDALVFKRPRKAPPGKQIVDVVLDPLISKKLRDHQRAGIKFLYECVMGLRDFDGQGCILADDMGLGKTLQTIALIWTLVKQNPIYKDDPVIKKILIVCPVTLVQNWKKEFRKWLGRDKLGVMSFGDEGSRLSMFDGRNFKVMIVGYERLQKIAEDLSRGPGIDLVICDEGHRLKSLQNKSTKAIDSLNTSRRVILSGTPIQNDLKEFFAMVNFVNDGVLGTQKSFIKNYEKPIEKSRQPNATDDDIEKGQECSDEIAQLTKPFILRRTADVVKNFLPPKTEFVLFCRPTPGQAALYRNVVQTPMFKAVLGSGASNEGALQMITILKKLCNSPMLLRPKDGADDTTQKSSLETLNEMLPAGQHKYFHNQYASKIRLLDELLVHIRETTNDKVVLVSNYTATLDLMAMLLSTQNLPYRRLDGSVPAGKRLAMVDEFNRVPRNACFAFLLSAKAGGVGINLIGGNRLVLFDVDWNPATDDQAMARIHREGQKKPCYIYRFLIKGGLEERIWQRQVVKRGLADSIMDSGAGANGKSGQSKAAFSKEELKDLFRIDESEGLRTHELIGCRCNGLIGSSADQSPFAEIQDIDEVQSTGSVDTEDDEPVRTFSFTRVSQISEQDIEDQEQSISTGSSPHKHHKKLKEQDELEELMTYTHIDTSGVSELEEAEALMNIETTINDSCLMDVLRQGRDLIPGSIDYVFMKRTGADEESPLSGAEEDVDIAVSKVDGGKKISGFMAA